MLINASLVENLRVSVGSVKTNKLRTILTMLIIALGIMALVGILRPLIRSRHNYQQFATMGANTFTIESRGFTVADRQKQIPQKESSLHHIPSGPGIQETV